MKAKKKMSKTKKAILLCILGVVLLGIAAIFIINSTYHYDPASSNNILAEGETGVLELDYCGADGKPASEEITYSKLETVALPEPTKQGYLFSGWTVDGYYVGNEVTLNAKTAKAKAQFDKDYTAISSACAVYTDSAAYTEFDEGAYASVNLQATDVYLDGGYKLTVFSKENFGGEQTKVFYSGMFSGKIGSMKIEAVKSESVRVSTLTDDEKIDLLTTFAPRIWWEEDEQFFAASVEDAAANMDKIMTPNGYAYYIKDVDSPYFMNDFLYGDLKNAKAYAFATEKEIKYLDLSYFVFMPYNLGKTIAGMEFGNHVGDWEHITVRLLKEGSGNKLSYRPVLVEYSAHFMRNYYSWDEVEIVEGTHPVGYTARGSHGMWKDAGTHIYVNAVVVQLKDFCSQGTAWDLWQRGKMETYAYDAKTHQGKGLGGSEWLRDFDLDVSHEDGGVTIWGNVGWKPPVQIYPRFDSAPSGPQHKQSLNNYYTCNGKNEK